MKLDVVNRAFLKRKSRRHGHLRPNPLVMRLMREALARPPRDGAPAESV